MPGMQLCTVVGDQDSAQAPSLEPGERLLHGGG